MVVLPVGNNDPEGSPAVCVSVSPGQLSVAVGAAQLTTAPQVPAVALMLILPGHETKTGS